VLNAPPREKTWRDYAGQNPRSRRNSSPVLSGIAKDGGLYKVARKSSTGEWCVTAYVPVEGGGWKRHEGKTYYGDSKEDAVGTFNYIMGPKGPTRMNPLSRRETAQIVTRVRDVARSARRAKKFGQTEDAKKYLAYGRGLLGAAHSFAPRSARRVVGAWLVRWWIRGWSWQSPCHTFKEIESNSNK